MIKELITIKKILEDSDFDFKVNTNLNRDKLICMPLEYILEDYIEMYSMLWDIQRIFDKMEREVKENELQRSTGTEI